MVLFIANSMLAFAGNASMLYDGDIEKTGDDNQAALKQQTFNFIYVAPDNNMDMRNLLSELGGYKDSDDPTVFYFVAGDAPIVMRCNMVDDNSSGFDDFIKDYLKWDMSKWTVNPISDKSNILSLLSKYDFLDENGELKYKEVQIIFNVGEAFWTEGYNETVIAALFFELNVAEYLEKGMQFRIFLRGTSEFDNDNPFGAMNFDNINKNKKIKIIPVE